MASSITTSTGTVVSVEDRGALVPNRTVILDHPDAPDDMRHSEVGRIIEGGFQPAPFAAWAATPETLRAIADLVESEGS